jgi:hypothetical protein
MLGRRKFGNGFCNGCNGCNGCQEEGRRKKIKEEGRRKKEENQWFQNFFAISNLKSQIV